MYLGLEAVDLNAFQVPKDIKTAHLIGKSFSVNSAALMSSVEGVGQGDACTVSSRHGCTMVSSKQTLVPGKKKQISSGNICWVGACPAISGVPVAAKAVEPGAGILKDVWA